MSDTTGTLFVVGTPIGNLGDITVRALDILRTVDGVLCEDTRVTRKLLAHYAISVPLHALHHHSAPALCERYCGEMKKGRSYALVTDAGTPGVSDPGNAMVAIASDADIPIVAIPGPSAMTAMVSIAGIDLQRFLFLAYPPHKKGRETFFRMIATRTMPVVYYDSVHRVCKNLSLLATLCPDARVIVGRELTKIHENVVRGCVADVVAHFAAHPDTVRGEFVIVVY